MKFAYRKNSFFLDDSFRSWQLSVAYKNVAKNTRPYTEPNKLSLVRRNYQIPWRPFFPYPNHNIFPILYSKIRTWGLKWCKKSRGSWFVFVFKQQQYDQRSKRVAERLITCITPLSFVRILLSRAVLSPNSLSLLPFEMLPPLISHYSSFSPQLLFRTLFVCTVKVMLVFLSPLHLTLFPPFITTLHLFLSLCLSFASLFYLQIWPLYIKKQRAFYSVQAIA